MYMYICIYVCICICNCCSNPGAPNYRMHTFPETNNQATVAQHVTLCVRNSATRVGPRWVSVDMAATDS